MLKQKRIAGSLIVLSLAFWTFSEQAGARGPRGFSRGGSRAGARAAGAVRPGSGRSLPNVSGRPAPGFGAGAPGRGGVGRPSFSSGAAAFQKNRPAGLGRQGNRPQPQTTPRRDSFGSGAQSVQQGRAASVQNRRSNLQSATHNAVNAWTTGPQPFTAAWYLEHPNAWKVTHPYAPAVAVALTTASVAAWLARPVVSSAPTVVVAGDDAEADGADDDTSSAESSADSGASPNGSAGDASADQTVWMPLGIFTVYAPGETLPTRMIELALAQDGRVGGTHYDRLRNEIDTVSGTIDRSTMVLRWKIGEKGGVFETPLDALTEAEASITVHLPDGAVTQWRLVKRGS